MSRILELLKGREMCRFDTGQIIIQQGEQSNRLYFLIEGEVEVLRDEVAIATASEPGAVFGEMAVLLGGRHTATVRALSPCAFHTVENPREFLESSPAASMHVCNLLARRLDALNGYLVDVKRQFTGHDHIAMVGEVLDTLLHRQTPHRVRPKDSTVRHGELPE